MDDEWRYVVLSVGTFIFVFVLLLACVRSCARLSEEAVLGRMEVSERARYLAAASNGRHIRWMVRPWSIAAPATTPTTTTNTRRNGSIFVISGDHLQSSGTTAAYDVTTTRSIIAAAHYESQLPSYEEATSGLPSYDLVTECEKGNRKAMTTTTDKVPPEYCDATCKH